MKKAYAVIGANFGDEGKGLVTDFLASRLGRETMVVRFNGGSQAGHTVTTPEGIRHIFGHFGSGTLYGCPTFLSRFFVVNPLTFLKELGQLKKLGIDPVVNIDPRALVTTPFDMMINQYCEESRGASRHGSCGLGFSETIERSQFAPYAITANDLKNPDVAREKLNLIREEWTQKRLNGLGLFPPTSPWDNYLSSPQLIEKFMDDVEEFKKHIEIAHPSILRRNTPILFEGAQGLLLDPQYGFFPHVTRSSTGIANVLTLSAEAGIDEIDAHYLTRAYTTRHGAGPLPHETDGPPYPDIFDATNIPNQYQGRLRFALPDVDLISSTIRRDLAQNRNDIKVTNSLVVTCVDQVGTSIRFIHKGLEHEDDPLSFVDLMAQKTDAKNVLISQGPTREDVSTTFFPLYINTVNMEVCYGL